MNIGFLQLLFIILICFLLFGNVSDVFHNLNNLFQKLKNLLNNNK